MSKEVLSQHTNEYQNWVEAFARNPTIPIEWAGKGVRKEDYVLPALLRMGKKNAFGSLLYLPEHGNQAHVPDQLAEVSFAGPQLPHPGASSQPLHPLLLLDPGRGARTEHGPHGIVFPPHATYWLNGHSFIEGELIPGGIGFRQDHNAFLAVDEVAALQAAADRLSPQIIRKQLDYWTVSGSTI